MPDIKLAVQDAFFDALNVVAVTGLAGLYQYVPEKSQPPLVIIGDISLEPVGGKDGGLDRATVQVITVSRQPSRRQLYQMQNAVRDLLDGVTIAAATLAAFTPIQEVTEDALLEDGITYQGNQIFSAVVQPA